MGRPREDNRSSSFELFQIVSVSLLDRHYAFHLSNSARPGRVCRRRHGSRALFVQGQCLESSSVLEHLPVRQRADQSRS